MNGVMTSPCVHSISPDSPTSSRRRAPYKSELVLVPKQLTPVTPPRLRVFGSLVAAAAAAV